MESQHSSFNAQEEQSKQDLSSLPPEKLITKCKNYLLLAQKAKIAKDDAVNKNAILFEENEKLTTKLSLVDKQLLTSQELLAALTEQKLNLSMELDDLKKFKIKCLSEIQNLKVNCNEKETEADSYKRQYTKFVSENEQLLSKLELTEKKLLADSKKAAQMQTDIKKLHENNENIKLLWSNVSKEKQELEECLTETNSKLTSLQKEHDLFFSFLSEKCNMINVTNDTNSWIKCIENVYLMEKETADQIDGNKRFDDFQLVLNENSYLKNELEVLKVSLDALNVEKEAADTELTELLQRNAQLNSDLSSVNCDRDKMIHNLEDVRIETDKLIQNSEKMSDEIEILKKEKIKLESDLYSVVSEIKILNQDFNEKKLENDRILEKLNSVQSENDSLVFEFQSNKNEFDKIKKELIENLKLKEEENQKLRNELEDSKTELNEIKDKWLNKYELLQKENIGLKNEINSVSNTLLNEQLKLKSFDEMKDSLLNEIKTLKLKCDTVIFENSALSEELKENKGNYDEITAQLNKVSEEHKQCEERFNLLLTNQSELQCIINEKETIINKFKNKTNVENENSLKIFNLESEKSNLNVIINDLTKEMENIKFENRNYQNKLDKINYDFNLLESNFMESKEELEGQRITVINLQTQLEQSESAIKTKEAEIIQLSSNIEELDKIKMSLTMDKELLSQKVSSDIVEKKNNVKLLFELQEKNKLLSNYNTIIQNSIVEMNHLGNEFIGCEELNSELDSSIIKNESNDEINLKENIQTFKKKLELIKVTSSKTNELIEKLKGEIDGRLNEISSLKDEVSVIFEQKMELEKQVLELISDNNFLKLQLEQLNRKTEDAHENKIEDLNKELKDILNSKNEEIEEINRIWVARLTTLKGNLVGLKQTNEDVVRYFKDFQNHHSIHYPHVMADIQERVTYFVQHTIAANKHELLAEMQHMNQVLKERGEMISKLQDMVSESKIKLSQISEENQSIQKELFCCKNTLIGKEELIKNKDASIKELETELIKIREAHDNNTEVDIMSSSTISKAEEISRLKDIEESFEDKYAKLKLLAIKLKKRLTEVTLTLESEKEDSKKIASEKLELLDKIQNLSSVAKNAQKVQEMCDKLMDEVEEAKKENHSLKVALTNAEKNEDLHKAKVLNLENDVKNIPVLKKQIESLEISLKDSKKEILNMNNEKKVDVMKYEDLKKEFAKLENNLSEVKSSLLLAKQQGRASNVLELEMQNYEKTITELSIQLNLEKESIKSLTEDISALKNLNNGFEEQIKLLEERLKVEEERNLYSNDQITTNHERIMELQNQIDKQSFTIEDLVKELQSEKNQNETLVIEISTIGSDFKQREKELNLQVDTLQSNVRSLETSLALVNQDFICSQSEIEQVRNDFESYRVRAQSVLAKQKGDVVTQGEKDAKQQIELLNKEVDILKKKLDSAMTQIEANKSECSLYITEKERADKRLEDLSKAVHRKTEECDRISADFRSYKVSTETLIQCYKAELEDKELHYKTELVNYQKQIDDLKFKLDQKEISKIDSQFISNSDRNEENFTLTLPQTDSDSLPPEREDGEGSESVPSPKGRRQSFLIPLDVLLNSPVDLESKITALTEEVDQFKKEVASYEIRTKHLSCLLSEAERDSARNSQLNLALKEEVRRLERSLERQPHVANTEYLKNVVLKFLTLQSGDERSRLVPVMDTILRLSPEETNKLSAVARGENSLSWGNYLPSWTGL